MISYIVSRPYLIIGGMILIIIGAGIWYFNWSQTKIENLSNELAVAQIAIKEQEAILKDIDDQIEKMKFLNQQFNTQVANIRTKANELSKKISQINLNQLGNDDPSKLEQSINLEMNKFFKSLENLDTGDNK